MKLFAADLHLHSVLSPCDDLSMSPSRILERARALWLDLISHTDHNKAENGSALRALAAGSGVSVLYRMELETVEEVHLLCLFDALEEALAWQEVVYARLPDIANDPDRFGDQVVVDADENIVRFEPRLLANASGIPLADACALVTERGGLAIPAHVDRPAQSLVSQLGFPPPGLPLDAVELTRHAPADFAARHAWWMKDTAVVRFSDAHFPDDIGAQHTLFRLEALTVAEIRLALRGEAGREAVGYGSGG